MGSSQRVCGPVAAGTERALLGLFVLIRAAVLAQIGWSLVFTWERYRLPALALASAAVVTAESAVVVLSALRRGVLDSRSLMLGDVGTATAATIAGTLLLTGSANPVTDNVFYPYAVTSVSIAGLAARSLRGLLAVPFAAAASYVAATGLRFGFAPGLFVNAFTYWEYAVIAWLLARTLRRVSRAADEAREAAAARACEAAAERERLRISRELHDRVLQTLEFVGREVWISDPLIRNRIAEETMWLRTHIERAGERPAPGEVTAILDAVVRRQVRAGMQVEMNAARAAGVTVPASTGEALAGAVAEALTNVRKHAGTTAAVVRAVATATELVVTVVDRGRGFDSACTGPGFGMRQSIAARVEQAGGTATVTAFPGEGTQVELKLPLVGQPGAVHRERPRDRRSLAP